MRNLIQHSPQPMEHIDRKNKYSWIRKIHEVIVRKEKITWFVEVEDFSNITIERQLSGQSDWKEITP